jgi:deoxyribonuclease I
LTEESSHPIVLGMNIERILIILVFFVMPLQARTLHSDDLKEELHRKASQGHRSFNYKEARKILFNELHLEKDSRGYFVSGVYCLDKLYPFNGEFPGDRLPDASYLNTEHTWPQSKFSRAFPKEVQKTDLHHLYPTQSRINGERGNYPFAEVNRERNLSCDESELGSPATGESGTYFEPPHVHKGNVARAIFYFSIRYKMEIDPVQEHFLRRWHKEDPIDDAERKRHEGIVKAQKNRNPFIDDPSLVEKISDF